MRILAVDTTSAHGSIAVLEGTELAGILGFRTARPRHAENLLPSLDYLLRHLDARLAEVEALAVAVGPGSFTGLRIGVAAVEGLAYSLRRPAVGVSTLDATAHRYRHRRGVIASFIEAYRGEIYGACYRSDGETVTALGAPRCCPPASFLDDLSASVELFAGSGTVSHRELLTKRLSSDVTIAAPSLFLAEDVARLGAEKLKRGEHAPLGGLDALYVRPSEAERNRRAREGTEV